jgi:integrase/recombinase XerC
MDRVGRGGGRLTGDGLYKVVKAQGEQLGLRARPHAIRHTSITAALDAGLDIRIVQRYSRHRDVRTLLIYDDARRDLAGDVAAKVAAALTG